MTSACRKYCLEAIQLSETLLQLADDGNADCDDDRCLVLFRHHPGFGLQDTPGGGKKAQNTGGGNGKARTQIWARFLTKF